MFTELNPHLVVLGLFPSHRASSPHPLRAHTPPLYVRVGGRGAGWDTRAHTQNEMGVVS